MIGGENGRGCTSVGLREIQSVRTGNLNAAKANGLCAQTLHCDDLHRASLAGSGVESQRIGASTEGRTLNTLSALLDRDQQRRKVHWWIERRTDRRRLAGKSGGKIHLVHGDAVGWSRIARIAEWHLRIHQAVQEVCVRQLNRRSGELRCGSRIENEKWQAATSKI